MKPFVIILLMLMVNIAQAQIFKCQAGIGRVIYQDEECANSSIQTEVAIKEIDPDKTRKAQEKLSKELQQREDIEANRATQTLK